MRRPVLALSLAALAVGLLSASPRLDAQGDARIRVQLVPRCNIVTLTVTEDDRGLWVVGSDDHCGLGRPTPLSGRAQRFADGGLRIALYLHDGGQMQFVSLELDRSARAGTWRDAAGRAGMATPPSPSARPSPPRDARSTTGSRRAHAAAVGVSRSFAFVPTAPANDSVSSSFFPRSVCLHGRELLGIENSEFICSDVVTPAPRGASDIALGSDGNPVFVGPGVGASGVVLTHCGNPACSAGNTEVAVSTTATGGRIAVGIDGLPLVAMVSAGAVTVIKCGDLQCTNGLESTLSPSGSVSSLAIGSDGLPLLLGSSAGLVRLVHCGDAACLSGNTTVDLQLQDATVFEPDLAIAPNGLPVIAFRYDVPLPYPQVEDGVRLYFCADLACSTGSTSGPVLSNTASLNNKFCCGLSLAIGIDGLPIVASHRMFWGLWTAHCNDGTCGSSANVNAVDDWTLPGINVHLLIGARGVPVMSHHGGNDWKLKVTECRDTACTGYHHPTRTLDISAIAGPNLLGSEGLPILVGGGTVVACGTKGCQPPATSVGPPVPGPMSVPTPPAQVPGGQSTAPATPRR